MRRDPSLTYQGALRILGHYDRPRLEKLDRLLGGVILGAGAAAGAAALAGPALAPLAGLAAIWGWVDQKNEATALARTLLAGASDRLGGTSGYERHQLIAAAHTAMAAGAFFEVLRESLGDELHREIAITDAERETLLLGRLRDTRESLYTAMYQHTVPAPSPARGYEENCDSILLWIRRLAVRTNDFLHGLEAWRGQPSLLSADLAELALARYRSHYLKMAATVPEFNVWANLGEHAATRNEIRNVSGAITAALAGQDTALSRIESLLGLVAGAPRSRRDACAAVHMANRGALDEHLVSDEATQTDLGLRFPTLREGFINPCYRLGVSGPGIQLADENWWAERPLRDDIDLLFTGHVTAPDSAGSPLLLLGHPGAGKSLLTKVLAARLPPSSYTVVRVALRRVAADAPVHDQIQQALDQATHRRAEWHELVEQSADTVRVVLLDGLDELLQAAGGRGGYLEEVADFQRREAQQERPVVVVVTSRTVVTDRVRIPDGTAVIKLEDFDEAQIARWLAAWNAANHDAIASGRVRGLEPRAVRGQTELAGQPLLLLILAVYSADPAAVELGDGISQADLYRCLLNDFAFREVAKHLPDAGPDEIDDAVREQLWRLTVAAFAMFNRGRQDVTDTELGSDLAALDEDAGPGAREADLGRRLLGQFFFVHTAEAMPHGDGGPRRSYEFLHATFGEFLMAAQVVEQLDAVTAAARAGRRGSRELNDELLCALLSFQPLAIRRTALTFAAEIFAELGEDAQTAMMRTLERLIAGHRSRHGSDLYAGYRPMPVDRLRQLAAYSANLVLLRATLKGRDHPTSPNQIWQDPDRALDLWRSTVDLWKAGLDTEGWQAVLSTIEYRDSLIRTKTNHALMTNMSDVEHARLIGDPDAEARLRYGHSLHHERTYITDSDRWVEVMCSWLVPEGSPRDQRGSHVILIPPPGDADVADVSDVNRMLGRLIRAQAHLMPERMVRAILVWLFDVAGSDIPDPYALLAAVSAHPALGRSLTALFDERSYVGVSFAPLILRAAADRSWDVAPHLRSLAQRIEALPEHRGPDDEDGLRDGVMALVEAYKWPVPRRYYSLVQADTIGGPYDFFEGFDTPGPD